MIFENQWCIKNLPAVLKSQTAPLIFSIFLPLWCHFPSWKCKLKKLLFYIKSTLKKMHRSNGCLFSFFLSIRIFPVQFALQRTKKKRKKDRPCYAYIHRGLCILMLQSCLTRFQLKLSLRAKQQQWASTDFGVLLKGFVFRKYFVNGFFKLRFLGY